VILTVKNRTISGPRSGVSYSGGLGGQAGNALDQLPGGPLFAPRLNAPSDEACGCHARHVPYD